MGVTVNKETCTGCGECKPACPCDAIAIVDDVAVIGDDCVGCGACVDTCPTASIKID